MKTDEDMSETYYVVTYAGPFGFIKPWTAVRDELTYSQQFLKIGRASCRERVSSPV